MSTYMRWIAACSCALCFSLPARCQTAGSISGRTVTSDGRPLRGFVILQLQPLAGSHAQPAPPQRVFTSANGAFQFSSLAAGTYTLCTSPLPNQGRNRQEALVDGCEWRQLQTVTLAAGQTVSTVTLTVSAGSLFQVHVNDPAGSLAATGQAPSANSPAPPDPQLVVMLKGQDRLLHHVPATARAVGNRDHSLVVPTGVAVSLIVRSQRFNVVDDAGHALTGELPVAAATSAVASPPVNVTIRGGRP